MQTISIARLGMIGLGLAATLDEAIAHYESGGRTISSRANARMGAASPYKSGFVKGFTLDPRERADLIAFLTSLTDPVFLRNPEFSDPWTKPVSSATLSARQPAGSR